MTVLSAILTFAKATVQREEQAFNNFIETCESKGFTKAEAIRIFEVYRKIKVITLDRNSHRWKVKHGAFWDKDTLSNALK